MRVRLFNRQIRILLVVDTLVLTAGAMLGPIYAIFVEKVGGGLMEAGITGAVFALSGGITTLLAGRFVDRIENKKLMIIFGYALMGIGFFLYVFVESVYSLFLVQALIGFSQAIYLPAYDAVFSEYVSKKKAGKEWGAWEASDYFAEFLGASMGGIVAALFGFKAVFLCMSVLCFGSAVYLYRLPKKVL